MPYFEIEFKLGPQYSGNEWPIVEMATVMEFPITTTMDMNTKTMK